MTLVRWDPFRELMGVQSRLNQILSDGGERQEDVYGAWAPPVDIFERGEDLVIRAEVPGVDKDQLDIQVEDGMLALSGERRRDEQVREDNAYRLERSYGRFNRSFRLPTTVDTTKINARYNDGILEIVLPKLEEAKPRKVKIHAA